MSSASVDIEPLIYSAKGGQVANPHPKAPAFPKPYVAPPDLVEAVNLALFLRRPLLVEGEAGCGKTQLAQAVAYELGLAYYPWYVRSGSRARDGQYEYDALQRLYDVETTRAGISPPRDPGDPTGYRRLGALGQAFQERIRPAVVLIDEIDKADIDFPNDLLTVLDDPWSFDIPETGETIAADRNNLPLVVITSNKEKGNLPAPFLRRCIYFYLPFPDSVEQLTAIVDAHYASEPVKKETPTSPPPPAELTAAAAGRFLQLRRETGLHKNPGTSEFLDWLEALRGFQSQPFPATDLRASSNIGEEQALPLPYPELLFKMRLDFLRHAAAPKAGLSSDAASQGS